MRPRTLLRLAWATFVLDAVLLVGAPLFWLATLSDRYPLDLSATAIAPFVAVGILILARQPHNGIGWVLLGIGAVWGVTDVAMTYGTYAWARYTGDLPGAGVAMAVGAASWVPGVGLPGTFLLLLFPDGRLPTARWKPWAWFCVAALVVPTIVITFAPAPLDQPPLEDVANPLGIESLRGLFDMLLASIALVPIAILGCAVALIVRFRRSRGTERLQLKWLTTAAATVATIYFFAMAISFNQSWGGEDTPYWISIVQNVAFLSFVLIPLAMAFAILRYRLYDIDLIINRTLVYGALTAILGAAYVLIVTVAGTILQGSDIVTAVATLSVAGLFRPLRRRIQGFIDRRFYRRRYDAARTMEAFTGSLRNEVDLEAMRLELLAAVHETLRPRRVSLWLKSGS